MFSLNFQVQGEVLTGCRSWKAPLEVLRVQAVLFHKGWQEGAGWSPRPCKQGQSAGTSVPTASHWVEELVVILSSGSVLSP